MDGFVQFPYSIRKGTLKNKYSRREPLVHFIKSSKGDVPTSYQQSYGVPNNDRRCRPTLIEDICDISPIDLRGIIAAAEEAELSQINHQRYIDLLHSEGLLSSCRPPWVPDFPHLSSDEELSPPQTDTEKEETDKEKEEK